MRERESARVVNVSEKMLYDSRKRQDGEREIMTDIYMKDVYKRQGICINVLCMNLISKCDYCFYN